MVKGLTLSALLFLAACQNLPQAQGDFCYRNEPFRPSDEQVDAMSKEQVERMLEHNERGVKLCGWKR